MPSAERSRSSPTSSRSLSLSATKRSSATRGSQTRSGSPSPAHTTGCAVRSRAYASSSRAAQRPRSRRHASKRRYGTDRDWRLPQTSCRAWLACVAPLSASEHGWPPPGSAWWPSAPWPWRAGTSGGARRKSSLRSPRRARPGAGARSRRPVPSKPIPTCARRRAAAPSPRALATPARPPRARRWQGASWTRPARPCPARWCVSRRESGEASARCGRGPRRREPTGASRRELPCPRPVASTWP